MRLIYLGTIDIMHMGVDVSELLLRRTSKVAATAAMVYNNRRPCVGWATVAGS